MLELLRVSPERLFERGRVECGTPPPSYRAAVHDVLAWMDQQAALFELEGAR
ncbi:MAG TPA: hypothetical protein RMI29_13220 [Polyangiaceae bacterium LLY-WYZ-15_(1-7)]|nr:hypothetical protein [Polyangiaceae bacterium LLY-WYZ-15_(1-7)]